MFDNNRQLLEQILCALQRIQESSADNTKLLMVISAEQIAAKQLLQHIVDNTNPRPLTHSIANRFSGVHMPNDVLVLNVGQSSIDTITPFLADGVTPSDGVVSGVTVTFTDPSATFVINPDNTVTFTAVAPTAGGVPVSGSVACTVTDTDSAVSTWNQAFTVFVNAPVPPAQLTQSIANVFSAPV